MSQQSLEQRIAVLERKVSELEAAITDGSDNKAWQRTFGMFRGDETIKRIDEAGRKWREAERKKKARGQKPKTKKTKA
jgi:hypothetical protein